MILNFDSQDELISYVLDIFQKVGIAEICKECGKTDKCCCRILFRGKCKYFGENGCLKRNWNCTLYLCEDLKRRFPKVRDYLRYLKENVRVETVTSVITPIKLKGWKNEGV